MAENLEIEEAAAKHILQRGARMKMRAPWFLRMVGKKTVSITIRSPYEGTMHRVAVYYLSTGIKSHQLEDITIENALAMMAVHGKSISKAVAVAWLNGYWSGKLLTNIVARYMRWHCTPEELLALTNVLLVYGGASDFMNTTRSVRMMKITAPRMGQ